MNNTIAQIIRLYKKELQSIYDKEELDSIIYIVFEHVSGYKKMELLLQKETVVKEPEYLHLLNILRELQQNKPVQYVLGSTAFYGLHFKVNSHVLIPRQETEELVDWIIKSVSKQENQNLQLLDIGTGSGCIAIALKKHLPASKVFALDISEGALAIALVNAQINAADIQFMQQDILAKDVGTELPDVDIIVSNPPYIRDSEKALMQKNVLDFEPHLALFVNDSQALLYYEAIADVAMKKLRQHGILFFEINEEKGAAVCKMLEQKGFTEIELRKDLNGKDRMVKCSKV